MVEVEKDPEGWNKDLYEDLSFENLIKSVKNSTIDAWNQAYEAYLSSEWKRLFPAKNWDPKYISELASPDSNFVRPDYSVKNFSERMKRTGLFNGIHLDGANFTHANLNGTDFTGSSLESANFTGAQLKAAKFSNSHLEGAKFNMANLEGMQAISSHFEKANFNLARLEGSQFNKSHLEGANFRFTIVRGTQFINITLDDKTDFTGTYLAEIIIEQNLRRELERNIRNLDTANKNVFVVLKCGCSKLDVILNKAIKPACLECGGLEAFTVDEKVSNGWVSQEIKDGIRDARFVISDLTYRHPGVYYETGYAEGLGIPVIRTCKESWYNKKKNSKKNQQKDPLHFDIAQRNTLYWKDEVDLKQQLTAKIQELQETGK